MIFRMSNQPMTRVYPTREGPCYHPGMVDLEFQEGDESVECASCGADLPAFLDGCPYCDGDQAEDDDLLNCSACGAEIYGDSVQCPVCGAYATPRVQGRGRPMSRILVFVAVALVLILLWRAAS